MNKKTYIVIGLVVVVALLLLVSVLRTTSLGGLTHNVVETFVPGIIVGSNEEPACFKVQDTDKAGWSYITYLNGVATTTGGVAAAFTIPAPCVGK